MHKIVRLFSLLIAIALCTPSHALAPQALAQRFLAPDAGFNSTGFATTNIGWLQTNAVATQVIVQPDGKVLSAGRSCQTTLLGATPYQDCGPVILVRHTADGALDASFGISGVLTTTITYYLFAPAQSNGQHIALQPDGKILVAGSIGSGAALARYTPSGALDTTFGNGGLVGPPHSTFVAIIALAVQADGKVVVAGNRSSLTNVCVILARYLPDGRLDGTFGTGGVSIPCDTNPSDYTGISRPSVIRIQRSGAIVVLGDLTGIVRFLPNGQLDGSFTTINLSSLSEINELQLLPDDKILLASRFGFTLQRLTMDGKPDASFGTGGTITAPSPTVITGMSMAVQSDGKILRVGKGIDRVPNSTPNDLYCCETDVLLVARHNADGTLDTTFGSGGMLTRTIGSGDVHPAKIAVQSDGKVLVAGDVRQQRSSQYGVMRLQANGAVDSAFGSGGVAAFGLFGGSNDEVSVLKIQTDGKIVAVGNSLIEQGRRAVSVARYLPTGALDPAFGTAGKVIAGFDPAANLSLVAKDAAVQTDGKIVVGADVTANECNSSIVNYCPGPSFALMRFAANGVLDPGFGTNGIMTTTTTTTTGTSQLLKVAVKPDGQIITVGWSCAPVIISFDCDASSSYILFFVHLLSNGTPDPTFGTGGVVTQTRPTATFGYDQPSDAVISADGAVLIASITVGATTLSVQRYTADGQLDTAFGTNGLATFTPADAGVSFSFVRDLRLAMRPDGKIVLASARYLSGRGLPTNVGTSILLFKSDGTLDTGFGSQGQLLIRGYWLTPKMITTQSDQSLLVTSPRPIGYYPQPSYGGQYIVRVTSDGRLDPLFCANGVCIVNDAPDGPVALDTAGNLLFGGATDSTVTTDFALARFREFTATHSVSLPAVGRDTFK